MALLLADLGVTNTHRRPYTRDDNPFSEAQFKTLKYRPDFPECFGSLADARVFCQTFFTWYTGEHRHSGIGLMTPAVVHDGRADTMRDVRQLVLMTAYAAHPERFVRKPPQPPILPHAVWINPPKAQSASQDRAEATISTADDQRVALKVEALGVLSETVGLSPHAITTSTDEVLHPARIESAYLLFMASQGEPSDATKKLFMAEVFPFRQADQSMSAQEYDIWLASECEQ